jgi:hypothetical protein
VCAALAALAPFGLIDAAAAAILLDYWKHRDTLAAADVAAVVAHNAASGVPSEPVAVAARGSAVVVALVAGASSFRHIADVAVSYGEHAAVALALPVAIDGLMVTATPP